MPFIYKNGHLAYILMPEGRLLPNGSTYDYEYHLTDHLGNTRATYIAGANGTTTLSQTTAYYPFGLPINDLSSNLENNPYLYNGKKLHAELNMDLFDYGARYYDAQVGRFTTIDPLAEKYNFQSPYVYAANNPILYRDVLGLGIDSAYTVSKDGNIEKIKGKDGELGGTEFDVIYNKSDYNAGKREFDESGSKAGLKLESGVIQSRVHMEKEYILSDETKHLSTRDHYFIENSNTATKLFEFMANNTNVEWANVKYSANGTLGRKNFNLLVTSRNPLSVDATLTSWFVETGLTIIEYIHNHPSNSPIPSGKNSQIEGDIPHKNKTIKSSPNAVFYIYTNQKVNGKYYHSY